MSVTPTTINLQSEQPDIIPDARKARVYRNVRQPRVGDAGEREGDIANTPGDRFAQDDTEMREAALRSLVIARLCVNRVS